jgi:hypothetical protein
VCEKSHDLLPGSFLEEGHAGPVLRQAGDIIPSLILKPWAIETSPPRADCDNAGTSVGHLSWTVES